jgi:hypothetical protein
MHHYRIRMIYLLISLVVIVLGLASRRYGSYLPEFIATYAGDTLWALMAFLGFSILFPQMNVFHRGGVALGFSFLIEISQLYHAPWIDAVRGTTLGGLVLGFGFLWSDLVCYTVGVTVGVGIEALICTKLLR